MSRYSVQYLTTSSAIVTVEADSPEEARLAADEKFESPYICAQCSGWGRDEDEPSLELGDVWEQDESESGVWEA